MAINFPGSPNIGEEFTGGGFAWGWTGGAWEKVSESSSSSPLVKYYDISSSGKQIVNVSGNPGVYTIKVYNKTLDSTTTGTFSVLDGVNSIVFTGTLTDSDSQQTKDYAQAIFRSTENLGSIVFDLSASSWIIIEENEFYASSSPVSTITYATSQEITFTKAQKGILIGGGGGGGNGRDSGSNGGGGGGGSGRMLVIDIPVGTHSLIAGAGGSAAQSGGNTIFNGQTALGGSPGISVTGGNGTTGGAGGSGGGGGGGCRVAGGSGGSNGSAGTNGLPGIQGESGGVAGTGTNANFSSLTWATSGNGGGGGGQRGGGGGGGIYAGGGGGGGGNSSLSAGGGGGGGVLNGGNGVGNGGGGGSGGSGGLIILDI